jgi:formylglycine-generating enzyme required for sulfatase activity
MGSEPTGPTDVGALQRQLAELQAKLAAAQEAQAVGERSGSTDANSGTVNTGMQTIATQGGAVVQGAIQAGGHFIGRDFVQYVTNATQVDEDPEDAKSVIALYLHALVTDLAGLKLGEIDTSADQTRQTPLQLADVYVPLDTTLHIPEDATLAQWLSRERDRQRDDIHAQRPVSALEAVSEHRELTVLGKPGSGKSTFGASVLLAVAQAWQGHGDQMARLGETWAHGALLPIRVILRRFAEQLAPGDKAARAGDVWAFIAHDLDAGGYGLSTDAMKYVQRIARTQGALILLDGLDECGNSASRERVLGAVRELMRTAGPQCRFVLTARPYAWPSGPDPARGVYALADLDDAQIEQFIHRWYAALVERKWRSPGEAERKVGDLLAARHRPDLLPLARNPLLLTLMATLHTNRGRLPDDRADLYNESVDLLLLRWNRQIGADKALLDELAIPSLKLSDLREVLEELAFKVHEQNVGKEGTADIGEDRLVRAFRPLLNNSKDKGDVVVDYIEKRAGLLVGQGEKDGERQFTFPHRTFQEFLAACHLAAQDDFPAKCAQLARTAPAHWQIVLPLAARLAKAERGASAADELIGGSSIAEFRDRRQPDTTDWGCALLAGNQLLEIGLGAIHKSERTRAITTRVAGWLAASLPMHPDDGGASAVERAETGDVLAALGDPRFDPQRFHLPADDMLGFVRIPAEREFRIGTRKADAKRVEEIIDAAVRGYEINDSPVPTPELYIARYPVTVAQFRAFVEATGFEMGDAEALRDPDSRPMRWVSWRDARAYCDWLNKMLAASPVLEGIAVARLVREGRWRIELASELEWEKAARGGLPDAIYSWGDTPDANRANYDDSGIGDTSTVGCFPANGFGLHDMIGNVWEWTRSLWGKRYSEPDFPYPYDPDDRKREFLDADEEFWVMRGGSWNTYRGEARCAYRSRNPPYLRVSYLGFRVVLRSVPVSSL